jgi:hypothetical protein
MKHAFPLVLITGILVVCVPQSGRAEGQRIGFFANLGVMTKEGLSPYWLTLGPELVIPLGTSLSFNPEVTIWGSNFGFRSYYVVPGAIVNFRIGRITLGVGAVRRFWVSRYSSGDSSEKIAPKIQVGYRSRNSRIALIVVPLSTHNYVSFGVAFGMGF